MRRAAAVTGEEREAGRAAAAACLLGAAGARARREKSLVGSEVGFVEVVEVLVRGFEQGATVGAVALSVVEAIFWYFFRIEGFFLVMRIAELEIKAN